MRAQIGGAVSIYYESYRDNMHLPATWYRDSNICAPHFHAGIELVYMLQGELEAVINGQNLVLHENELLIVNCYAVHKFFSPDSYTLTSVIPLSAVPSMQKLLTSSRFKENIIADDQERNLIAMMKLLAGYPENKFVQKGICYAILGYLADHIPMEPMGSSDQVNVICSILNYLNDNFTQHLTVEQVATEFGYSRSRFSHMFKNTIGYSLPQYLNMLRCRSIAEALVSSDIPVVELAINAGFNNTHTFYSAFRSCYNMTPREYLVNHKHGIKKGETP